MATREHEVPEVTGVRRATSLATPSPEVGRGFTAPRTAAVPAKRRRANLGQGWHETDMFPGDALVPGNEITGPAIVEESFTTIVVYPGWRAVGDDAHDCELPRTA